MNALVCTKPGYFECTEIAEPSLQTGHAIFRIRNIDICGTDQHAFEGTQPFFYPRILGHELSGELMDYDDAPGFHRGEAVKKMVNRKFNPRSFITNRVKFKDAAAGFSDCLVPSNDVIKIIYR